MGAIGTIVMLVGALLALIGGIGILIEAFKEHILWGLGTFFFGPVGLVFVITHWEQAGKAFLLNLAGAGLMVVGMLMGAAGGVG